MLTFEPTISYGIIFQTVAMLAGAFVAWAKLTTDFALMKSDIASLKSSSDSFGKALQQLSAVLTQVAVQDNRLLNMEKKLDELAHGRGFVE